jgi:hypothetical protein
MNVKFEVPYQILNLHKTYATQNLFEDEKQTQLFNKMIKLCPYLDP